MHMSRTLVICFVLASETCFPQNSHPKVSLPDPTGPYSVGRLSLIWNDDSRPENPALRSGGTRHIPAHVFYPSTRSGKTGEYFPGISKITSQEAVSALAAQFGDAWPTVQSN